MQIICVAVLLLPYFQWIDIKFRRKSKARKAELQNEVYLALSLSAFLFKFSPSIAAFFFLSLFIPLWSKKKKNKKAEVFSCDKLTRIKKILLKVNVYAKHSSNCVAHFNEYYSLLNVTHHLLLYTIYVKLKNKNKKGNGIRTKTRKIRSAEKETNEWVQCEII